MQTTFIGKTGAVLFARDDMESGGWTVEEYTVDATFPFDAEKEIEHGQRFYFRNPATGNIEPFEVRNVTNVEPEHYQQIIAEHIVVAELSDEHIDTQEITDKTAAQALATALTGTLWAVGNSNVGAISSVDIARGSVWQAVCAIGYNWNAHIVPRVEIDAAGTITGRYLDIEQAHGTRRGVRLSISKNMTDASIVYDDSEVYTALYGYGGAVDTPRTGGDDGTEELTFANVVWTATAEHPAKPAGQTYIEDPAATALYGRNGRPRFGYYQNSGIDNAEVLLQKTWESLQQANKPKVSITGTVTDLYRLGYADQPICLHDVVVVEIEETGVLLEKDIIKLRVDLIDPTATVPEIGDYIENIIYIDRETDKSASGRGGGGRSPGSETNQYNTYAGLENATDKYGSMIGMVVGTRNGNNYVKAAEIALAINEDGSQAYISADHVKVDGETILTTALEEISTTVENTESDLRSEIRQTASNIMIEVGRKAQVFHQYSDPVTTEDVSEGDFWVKDSGMRTYGQAETQTWGELGQYTWASFFGSEIYVRDGDGWVLVGGDQLSEINHTRIDQTDDYIRLIADSFGGDFAGIAITQNRIESRVSSVEQGLTSVIEQTASMIRSAVFTANSEMYAEILQTQSMIRSEVTNVESNLTSEINQTASSIMLNVNRKSAVYFQMGDPRNNNPPITPNVNDVWIQSNKINTYADAAQYTWGELGQYTWLDYYGSKMWSWDGQKWQPISDDQKANYDYSLLEITRTELTSVKGDVSGAYSRITQTKNEIQSIVNDRVAGLQSVITQTASEIRTEVTNKTSSLQSLISQQADRISLVVQGTGSNAAIKAAQIVAAINEGGSSVLISANHITLDSNSTKLSDAIAIMLGRIALAKPVLLNDSMLVASGKGILFDDNNVGMTGTTLATTIKSASVSGSTLTLTTYSGSTINFSKPSDTPTINSVWTSTYIPSGAYILNSLKTQFRLAEADGDYFCIRVSCNGKTRTYYCEP